MRRACAATSRAHHRALDVMNPLCLTGCQWSGCGCPRFLPPVAPDSRTPATP